MPRTRQAVQELVAELTAHTPPSYGDLQVRDGIVIAIKARPTNQQALLVAPSSVDDLATDVDAYLLHELGVPYEEVRRQGIRWEASSPSPARFAAPRPDPR